MKKIIGLVLLCLVSSISNAFAENEEEFLKRLGLVSFMVAQVSFCQGNLTEEQDEAWRKWLDEAFKDKKPSKEYEKTMLRNVQAAKILADAMNAEDCKEVSDGLIFLLEALSTK